MISSLVARARDGVIPLLGEVSCIRATASKKRIKLIVTSHGLHHLESGDEKVLESQIGTARIFGKWIHVDIVAIEKKTIYTSQLCPVRRYISRKLYSVDRAKFLEMENVKSNLKNK